MQNILLVQSDRSDAKRIRDALGKSGNGSFHIEWVKRCADGLARLSPGQSTENQPAGAITAILLDLFLSDSQGIETFEKYFRIAPHIPILIVAADENEEAAQSAVRRGAQDYLLKSRLDAYILPKAVNSMIERAAIAEALFAERERAQVTLNSIGDGVMSTDANGKVSYLNTVAETMTGWSTLEAAGRPVEEVFRIIDATTRQAAQNPMALATSQDKVFGLTSNCILIRRDGVESAIENSAAPIHDRRGQVTGAVMIFHDVSQARATSARMSHLAQHDSLTDLPNRLLFNDRLTQAIAIARRRRQKLAVLFLDMDRFKYVNDSLGHDLGDRLLKSVAHRLLGCVRGSDTVSRQGGDEFVILLSEIAHAEDAAIIAGKILRALSTPHRIEQHVLHITGTIGGVTYPDDGMDAEALIKNADIAMYHAKEIGRNNFQFFKPEMNERALARQSLINDMRRALKRNEFALHYHPKLNLATGAIIAVEALIRWRHPEKGVISPTDFIPIAEQSGFMVPIGRWVLREACRQARVWQDAGLPRVRMAINISAVELRANDFAANVKGILKETGLDPRSLELELTEAFLIQDPNFTTTVLESLKDIGVQLALDDFGTGYSSLNYLTRFPLDALKIDRSFIRDLTMDSDDASIVSAIISMGKSLHMRVVAEGVETREQLTYLREHGCPEGQGYYFGQPVIAAEFAQLLGGKAAGANHGSVRAIGA